MSPHTRSSRLPGTLLAVLLASSVVGCGPDAPDAPGRRLDDGGSADAESPIRRLPYPLPKPDFTFVDMYGDPFDFRAETEGFVTLLFFGYTNCPDVCPVHMANIAAVLDDMPAESAGRIRTVFVTTDPERDTPERLREWLGALHPSFVGLRGPLDEIHEIERALLLPASVVESGHVSDGTADAGADSASAEGAHDGPGAGATPENASADGGAGHGEDGPASGGPREDYFVGHASAVVAFGANGQARTMYPWGVRQRDLAADLPRLVAEAGPPRGR